VEPAQTIKALLDNGHAWLDQATLADFISSGSYAKHLRRIRHTYRKRRDCLINALQRHFGNVQLTGSEGGMHIIWHLPNDFPNAIEVQKIAEEGGVGVYALEASAAICLHGDTCSQRALILGYSSLSESDIEKGIARLSKELSTSA
jgi:GntR family transcriptional regulator/MocR family aminotransferase